MSIELTMPRLSDTMESGTIIKWNVKEGDTVASGTSVADVETDKATMEMQTFDDGTIAKILVPEGKLVPIGTVIALLAEPGEDAKTVAASAGASTSQAPNGRPATSTPAPSAKSESPASTAPSSTAPARAPAASAPSPSTAQSAPPRTAPSTAGDESDRLRISPVARRMADDHGLDLRSLNGSGPGGRIVKEDVLAAIDSGRQVSSAGIVTRSPSSPRPSVPSSLSDHLIPLSGIRQTIAKRLVESKTTIPHYQVTMRFDMDALLALRTTLNAQLEAQGVKLSVNDFLVRACALAMHSSPEFNASWAGAEGVRVHGSVNIGIAIALPRERGGGLVVGVIRDADHKGLRQLSQEAKALGEKARGRGLGPEDISDSTFTISNLGMFGVDHFTAIINPPNSAILAVGAAIEQPVVRNGALAVGHQMSATLSLDHRVIDGAMAAEYLQTLKQSIENPAVLLV